MKAEKKVDWFCPKCNSYVSSESVTFEETHQICKTGVILEPLNQNNMKQTAVEWLQSKMPTAFKELTINKELFEQAKETDKAERAKEYLRGFEDGKEYMKKIKTFKSE